MSSLHLGAKLIQIARNLPSFQHLSEENAKLQESVTKLVKTNSQLTKEIELLKNAASVSDKKTQFLITRLEAAAKEKEVITKANAALEARVSAIPVTTSELPNVQQTTSALVGDSRQPLVQTTVSSTPSSSQRRAFLDGFDYSPDARLKRYWHKPFLTREDLEAMRADAAASTQGVPGLPPCDENRTHDNITTHTTTRPHLPDGGANRESAALKITGKSKAPAGAPSRDRPLLQRRQSRRLRNEPPT